MTHVLHVVVAKSQTVVRVFDEVTPILCRICRQRLPTGAKDHLVAYAEATKIEASGCDRPYPLGPRIDFLRFQIDTLQNSDEACEGARAILNA